MAIARSDYPTRALPIWCPHNPLYQPHPSTAELLYTFYWNILLLYWFTLLFFTDFFITLLNYSRTRQQLCILYWILYYLTETLYQSHRSKAKALIGSWITLHFVLNYLITLMNFFITLTEILYQPHTSTAELLYTLYWNILLL